MNPTLILRIAAVFSLLFAAGHTLGGRKDWSPMGDTEVLKSMRTTEFDTMNVKRTYLDFFRGFGYSLSVFLLLQSVVLWQLGTLAATNSAATRPMIAAFIVAAVANAVISAFFLFPVPAVFGGILTVILCVAFAAAG